MSVGDPAFITMGVPWGTAWAAFCQFGYELPPSSLRIGFVPLLTSSVIVQECVDFHRFLTLPVFLLLLISSVTPL